MTCPKCGAVLDEGTKVCPLCGEDLEAKEVATEQLPEETEAVSVQEESFEPVAKETAPKTPLEDEINFEPIPEEPKKKGLSPWVIIGAVVALIILLTACLLPNIIDSVNAMFMSPTEYYASLEAENIEEFLSSYNSSQELIENGYGSKGSLYLELTDESKALIESFTGLVLDNYISGGVKLEIATKANAKDNVKGVQGALLLNGVSLMDVNMVVDYENGVLYGSIPVLADGVFIQDMEASADQNTFTPEITAEAMKLLVKYCNLIIENIPEMTKTESSLTVLETAVGCDLYEMKFSQEEAVKLIVALCEQIKVDEEAIRTVFNGIAPELAEEIIAGADLLLEQANETLAEGDLTEEVLVYRAWIKDGEILGRELTFPDEEYGDAVIALYSFVSGGKLTTQFVVEEFGYELLSFEGTAKSADGVITNGEFVLKAEGVEALFLDVEKLSVDDGETEVKYTATFGDAVIDQMYEYATILEDLALEVSISSDKNKSENTVSIIYADEPLLVIGIEGEMAEYEDIVIPENAVDVETWALGADTQEFYLKILDSLEEAGVNPLITSMLGQLDVNQPLSGSVY